jgi:hypothetical protein
MNLVCADSYKKITRDQWDARPDDRKMTVMCGANATWLLPPDAVPRVRRRGNEAFD